MTCGPADCHLLYNCCTRDSIFQNTHRLLRHTWRSFDWGEGSLGLPGWQMFMPWRAWA
jgi:hypothetical protein